MIDPQFAPVPVKVSSQCIRLRAIAMQLIADSNGRYVEMHIVTDRGQTLVVSCESQSLLAVQRRIQDLNQGIPDISEWTPSDTVTQSRPIGLGQLRESDPASTQPRVPNPGIEP